MGQRQRLSPSDRAERIILAAKDIALKDGYKAVTREGVARVTGVSPALISHYMGSVGELQHRVIARAIADRDPRIVAQAMLDDHPLVRVQFIDDELRRVTQNYVQSKMV